MSHDHPKQGPGIHHIALRAYDFDATAQFYTEGLGFIPRYSWGEGEWRALLLDTGDGNYVELFAGGMEAKPEDPSRGFLHLALRVPSADDYYNRALTAGATTVSEPSDVLLKPTLPGTEPVLIRIAFCKGLDGEVIEFFQNDEL